MTNRERVDEWLGRSYASRAAQMTRLLDEVAAEAEQRGRAETRALYEGRPEEEPGTDHWTGVRDEVQALTQTRHPDDIRPQA